MHCTCVVARLVASPPLHCVLELLPLHKLLQLTRKNISTLHAERKYGKLQSKTL